MIRVKLAMPQANDGEEEWLCYTEAIKVASESLRHHRYPGRTREVGLQIGGTLPRNECDGERSVEKVSIIEDNGVEELEEHGGVYGGYDAGR